MRGQLEKFWTTTRARVPNLFSSHKDRPPNNKIELNSQEFGGRNNVEPSYGTGPM